MTRWGEALDGLGTCEEDQEPEWLLRARERFHRWFDARWPEADVNGFEGEK